MFLLVFIIKNINFGVMLQEIEFIAGNSDGIKISDVVDLKHEFVMLRGKMIPICNSCLGIDSCEENRKFFIVINVDEFKFGIAVEDIIGISYAEKTERIKVLPELVNKFEHYFRSVYIEQNKNILIIDVEKIVEKLKRK